MQSSPKKRKIVNLLLPPGTDKQEQQCRQLMAGLDKVVSDLDKQEKAIYSRVRPPLEQTRPVQDSADRLQDIRVQMNGICHKTYILMQFWWFD